MSALGTLVGGGIFAVLEKAIDRIWPDEETRDRMKLEIAKLSSTTELKNLEAQLKLAESQNAVNQVEASSRNLFVAGWRPFIGWVCGIGLCYQFLLRPIIGVILQSKGITDITPPALELESLMTLLFGMLGLGAFRTTEKLKGKAL